MSSKLKNLSQSLKVHAIKSLQFDNDVTAANRSNSESMKNIKKRRDELYDDQEFDFSQPEKECLFNESQMVISTPIKSANKLSSPLPHEQTFHTNNISMRSILNDTYHTNDITMCDDDNGTKND